RVCDTAALPLTRHAPLRCSHSFPTRRSSDLTTCPFPRKKKRWTSTQIRRTHRCGTHWKAPAGRWERSTSPLCAHGSVRRKTPFRSEEHTSELQSRFDLVCRLLLEKRNRKSAI